MELIIKGKYTDAVMFADTVEEGVYSQVYDIVNCRAFEGKKVRLMPDVHVGASGPCGLVAEIGDWICPNHIGVDIGCSVSMLTFDGRLSEADLPLFEHRVKKEIPMGFNINDRTVVNTREFLQHIAASFRVAKSIWPERLSGLPNSVDERWITKTLQRIGMDEGVFWKSLGTIGGGNHFIEYGEIEGQENASAVTFHFGSRNFGVKVCKHWMKQTAVPMTKDEIKDITAALREIWCRQNNGNMVGFKEHLKNKLAEAQSQFIKGYLTGEAMNGYLCDMVFAQAYAEFNHMTVRGIISKIASKFGMKPVQHIMCTHNYIDMNDHLIRKSSISAHYGETILVPMNMRDGTAVCMGRGNDNWLNSCCHGAGRKMSRSEAKRTITMDEFKSSMEGIVSTSVTKETIDESPMAYKDTSEILDLIKDTADILFVVKPKISWKASEVDPRTKEMEE